MNTPTIINYQRFRHAFAGISLVAISLSLAVVWIAHGVMDLPIQWKDWLLAVLIPLLVAPVFAHMALQLSKNLAVLEIEKAMWTTVDALTGLLTRRTFVEKAEHLMQLALRENKSVCLLMASVNDLKPLNDTYGYQMGDMVLSSFGHLVQSAKRKSDLACRFGGGDFVFLLWGVNDEDAMKYAGQLHQKVVGSTDDRSSVVPYAISIGLTVCDFSRVDHVSYTLEQLIGQAEQARTMSKNPGEHPTQQYVAST